MITYKALECLSSCSTITSQKAVHDCHWRGVAHLKVPTYITSVCGNSALDKNNNNIIIIKYHCTVKPV